MTIRCRAVAHRREDVCRVGLEIAADHDAAHRGHEVIVVTATEDRSVRENALWNLIRVPGEVDGRKAAVRRAPVAMKSHLDAVLDVLAIPPECADDRAVR